MRPRFIFCPRQKIASPGPAAGGSTAAEKKRDGAQIPSHTQQNNTVALLSVSAREEKALFCRRPTLCPSIHPLLTDVDTVCSGLRCSLKTIVPLGSSVLLSFSSLFLGLGRRWRSGKSGERPPDGSQRSGGAFFLAQGRPPAMGFIVASSRQPRSAACSKYCVAGRTESPPPERGQRSSPIRAAPYLPCPPPSSPNWEAHKGKPVKRRYEEPPD